MVTLQENAIILERISLRLDKILRNNRKMLNKFRKKKYKKTILQKLNTPKEK